MSPISFVPPVLSALLGAIAIRSVETLYARRSSFIGLHHQLVENYYKIEGEINDVMKDDWERSYTREVNLDSFEAARFQTPNLYRELVQESDSFVDAKMSLEYIRREMIESRAGGAYVKESPSEVEGRLLEIQEAVREGEESMREFAEDSLFRRVLYGTAIEDPKLEENPATSPEILVRSSH